MWFVVLHRLESRNIWSFRVLGIHDGYIQSEVKNVTNVWLETADSIVGGCALSNKSRYITLSLWLIIYNIWDGRVALLLGSFCLIGALENAVVPSYGGCVASACVVILSITSRVGEVSLMLIESRVRLAVMTDKWSVNAYGTF